MWVEFCNLVYHFVMRDGLLENACAMKISWQKHMIKSFFAGCTFFAGLGENSCFALLAGSKEHWVVWFCGNCYLVLRGLGLILPNTQKMEVDTDTRTEGKEPDDSAYDQVYDNGTDSSGEKRKPRRRPFRPFKRPKIGPEQKPPLMVLNEKFGKTEFTIEQEGSGHQAVFVAKVTVNDTPYEGRGPSKQKAKTDAAAQALMANGIPFLSDSEGDRDEGPPPMMPPFGRPPLGMRPPFRGGMPFPGPRFGPGPVHRFGRPGPPRNRPPHQLWEWEKEPDFNADSMDIVDPSLGQSFDNEDAKKLVEHAEGMGPMFMKQLLKLSAMKIAVSIDKARQFPAMVMSEFFPDAKDKIIWHDHDGASQLYRCEITIWGRTFVAEGRGRRAAKNNLSKEVLSAILGISLSEFQGPPPKIPGSQHGESSKSSEPKPFSRRHPFSQVKILDPTATYDYESVKDESGMEKWCCKVTVRGKEFTATHAEKKIAKVHVAKAAGQAFEPPPDSELPPPAQLPQRKTAAAKEVDVSKHPVQLFNEFYPGIQFDEQEIRNPGQHMPQYVISVEVANNCFAETGTTKKKAKLRLAMQVFESLHNVDPSSWTMVTPAMLEDASPEAAAAKAQSGKSPVMLLNELHPKCEYEFTEGKSEDGRFKFFAKVTIGDQQFQGDGPNKKVAKSVAAQEALKSLYGIQDCNSVDVASLSNLGNKSDIPSENVDKIVQSVQDKCSQVFQADVQYKVIASVIMGKVSDSGDEMYEVISLGTGTKCISGGSINNKGQVLNDCHAEVIACRGLRQFLFDQLYLAMTGKASCMEKLSPRKYRLKTDFNLYLYINTAPCGDGRVFTSSGPQAKVGSTNKSAGLLRTKIENGQGILVILLQLLLTCFNLCMNVWLKVCL